MNKLKTIGIWALPILIPLMLVYGWDAFRFYSPPPVLSLKNEAGQPVPVQPFELTNHQGKTWASHNFQEHVSVTNFFFISCPDVCPRMNSRMKEVYLKFSDHEDFQMVSITVNPEKDTPEKMLQYARGMDVEDESWTFLTGDKRTIYRTARNDFKVSAAEGDGGATGFIHSEMLILVDREGLIRGYYESSDNRDISRLKKDLKYLLENA